MEQHKHIIHQNAQNFALVEKSLYVAFKQSSKNPFHWCITLDSTPNTVEVMAGATFDQKIGPWTLKKLKKGQKPEDLVKWLG